MSNTHATEYDLLSFFEVEPIKSDDEAIWFYNSLIYRIERAEHSLVFKIDPSYRTVEIHLEHKGLTLYRFTGEVNAVIYKQERGKEVLEILTDSQSIEISHKPNIFIRHWS